MVADGTLIAALGAPEASGIKPASIATRERCQRQVHLAPSSFKLMNMNQLNLLRLKIFVIVRPGMAE